MNLLPNYKVVIVTTRYHVYWRRDKGTSLGMWKMTIGSRFSQTSNSVVCHMYIVNQYQCNTCMSSILPLNGDDFSHIFLFSNVMHLCLAFTLLGGIDFMPPMFCFVQCILLWETFSLSLIFSCVEINISSQFCLSFISFFYL